MEAQVKSTTQAIKALQQVNNIPAETREDAAQLGFRPAFLDFATMSIYPSRSADGRAAPIHVLDGLPDEVIAIRTPCGRVIATKATLVAGYERRGFFYTQAAVIRATQEWHLLGD